MKSPNEIPHLNWFETILQVPLQSAILVVDLQDILVGFYLSGQSFQSCYGWISSGMLRMEDMGPSLQKMRV